METAPEMTPATKKRKPNSMARTKHTEHKKKEVCMSRSESDVAFCSIRVAMAVAVFPRSAVRRIEGHERRYIRATRNKSIWQGSGWFQTNIRLVFTMIARISGVHQPIQ